MANPDQSSAPLIPADAARAADADREAVAERLRIAAGDGRIDLAELDERLTQAYAAKTYGQLQALVADLPARTAADYCRVHDRFHHDRLHPGIVCAP
jgi:hypothetical protein